MIKTPQGAHWLTVPVKTHLGERINQVEITDISEYSRMSKTITMNYKKSKYFNETYSLIDDVFAKQYDNLHDLNMALLNRVLKKLDLKAKIIFSSQLEITTTKDDLVLEIIKKLGETEYLSGRGALAYMDLNKFRSNGISVNVTNFEYPPYPQLWGNQVPFIPNLSVIDLMFNDLPLVGQYIDTNGTVEKIC